MSKTRLLAGGSALALAVAVLAAPISHAAESSAGTSNTTTRVLEVELGSGGSLLALRLVGEDGTATTAKGTSALARLRSFDISSGTIGALNISGPVAEATSTGTRSVTPPALDLAAPAGAALPGGLIGGRIVPATLTASADANGARSSLGASIEGLTAAGGLISAGTLRSDLGATAAGTDAGGTRGLEATAIKVVDLGALLQGLGIQLPDLSVDVVSDLLAGLGVTIPELTGTATLDSVVGTLTTTIGGLTALVPAGTLTAADLGDLLGDDPVGEVTDALDPVVAPTDSAGNSLTDVLGTVSQPVTDLLASVGLTPDSTVQDLVNKINELTTQLTNTLKNALVALDAAPLLSVDDIKVGVQTKAARTVEASLSEVTATIGSVKVGSLVALPSLDATAVTDQLAAAVATVQAQLDSVLATINAGLAGVVKVSAFEKTSSVTPTSDGTKAVAGLTALTATIAPPADLANIVQSLTGAVGIGDMLTGAGLQVPALDGAMSQLTSTLGGLTGAGLQAQAVDLGALAQGGTIRLGSISSTSAFGSAAADIVPAPGGQLPRTGSDNLPVATALAALLIALGLGLPVWSEVGIDRRRTR